MTVTHGRKAVREFLLFKRNNAKTTRKTCPVPFLAVQTNTDKLDARLTCFPPGFLGSVRNYFLCFQRRKKKPICKHSFLSTLFFFASSKQKRWPYPLQVLTKRNHFPSFFLFPPCSQQPSQRTALRGFESRSEGEEGEETIEGCSLILLSLLRKRRPKAEMALRIRKEK